MHLADALRTYSTSIRRYTHSPGNGTRYEVIGVANGTDWLVIFPLMGIAHSFTERAFVSVYYVAEKFAYQSNGTRVCAVDLHEMTKCICAIIDGSHDARTDDQGRFPSNTSERFL